MWFRLPQGCGGISVERQEFAPEYTDREGWQYFRAPEHFATKILAIQGFAQVNPPEDNGDPPEDLPKDDPLRDGAIAELTATVEAQKTELQNLREDLNATTAQLKAVTAENTDLKTTIEIRDATIAELNEKLEEKA